MEQNIFKSSTTTRSCSEETSRDHSTSPARKLQSDRSKLQLVSLGSRFCLARSESTHLPLAKASEDQSPGRSAAPWRQSSCWPGSLRSRSNSDERSILKRVNSSQERGSSAELSSVVVREQRASVPTRGLTRSTTSGELHKPRIDPSVPRVKERIRSLQNSAGSSTRKVTTLPWNRLLDSTRTTELQHLRKTSSSPCLNVPLKMSSQTISSQNVQYVRPKKPMKIPTTDYKGFESQLSKVVFAGAKYQEKTDRPPRTVEEICKLQSLAVGTSGSVTELVNSRAVDYTSSPDKDTAGRGRKDDRKEISTVHSGQPEIYRTEDMTDTHSMTSASVSLRKSVNNEDRSKSQKLYTDDDTDDELPDEFDRHMTNSKIMSSISDVENINTGILPIEESTTTILNTKLENHYCITLDEHICENELNEDHDKEMHKEDNSSINIISEQIEMNPDSFSHRTGQVNDSLLQNRHSNKTQCGYFGQKFEMKGECEVNRSDATYNNSVVNENRISVSERNSFEKETDRLNPAVIQRSPPKDDIPVQQRYPSTTEYRPRRTQSQNPELNNGGLESRPPWLRETVNSWPRIQIRNSYPKPFVKQVTEEELRRQSFGDFNGGETAGCSPCIQPAGDHVDGDKREENTVYAGLRAPFQVQKSSSGNSETSEEEEIRKELQSILGNSQNFSVHQSTAAKVHIVNAPPKSDDIVLPVYQYHRGGGAVRPDGNRDHALLREKDWGKKSEVLEKAGRESESGRGDELQKEEGGGNVTRHTHSFPHLRSGYTTLESCDVKVAVKSSDPNVVKANDDELPMRDHQYEQKEYEPEPSRLQTADSQSVEGSGSTPSPGEERISRESSAESCDSDYIRNLRNRNSRERRNSIPEREIDTDDTENAELQVNLRKISGKLSDQHIVLKVEEADKPTETTETQIIPDSVIVSPLDSAGEEETDSDREEDDDKLVIEELEDAEDQTFMKKLEAVEDGGNSSSDPQKKETKRPSIFRLGRMKLRGNKSGVRRSRSWQGFGSGLRYESVSDAGLPPPPSTPPSSLQSAPSSPARKPRQSAYRPLSRTEFGPKCSAFPPPPPPSSGSVVRRSQSEGNLGRKCIQDEDIEYECVVTCKVRRKGEDEMSSSIVPSSVDREDLTPEQIDQLMAVIASMDTVKNISYTDREDRSPPPTDAEIKDFIDYVGMGVVNEDRLEFEVRKEEAGQPDPPKRNKQASQYFWRRHYLSIIQEEEEQGEQSAASSRAASRPASAYENGIFRLPRILALSPINNQNFEARQKEEKRDSRQSWESEMSVDSINSILSEEGSLASAGSFQSDSLVNDAGTTDEGRKASDSLSCLLESVPPPSNTPDAVPPRRTPESVSADKPIKTEGEHCVVSQTIATGMGTRFKQQLQAIEARKRNEGDPYEGEGTADGEDSAKYSESSDTNEIGGGAEEYSAQKGNANGEDTRDSKGLRRSTPTAVDTVEPAAETAAGIAVIPAVRRSAGRPRTDRKNLTISTLIAECEEYVQTDRFTQNLSSSLVNLFKGKQGDESASSSTRGGKGRSENSTRNPSDRGEKKPPKVPSSMRVKPHVDRTERSCDRGADRSAKFPRESVYDNVDSDVEDEGIDNYYSDDSGTPPKFGGGSRHESSPAQCSEGYDSAQESERRVKVDPGCRFSKEKRCENQDQRNPFLPSRQLTVNPFESDARNPFLNSYEGKNPFDESFESSSAATDTTEEMLMCEEEEMELGERNLIQDTLEDYESLMSDLEETLSILSRNSRSTTPASDMFSSRTPTPSITSAFSATDIASRISRSVSDKHVIPVVTVFDDLKDYLSDSDMSLDYKIAVQRRKLKKVKSLNKQAQMSNLLGGRKHGKQEHQLKKEEKKQFRKQLEDCYETQNKPGKILKPLTSHKAKTDDTNLREAKNSVENYVGDSSLLNSEAKTLENPKSSNNLHMSSIAATDLEERCTNTRSDDRLISSSKEKIQHFSNSERNQIPADSAQQNETRPSMTTSYPSSADQLQLKGKLVSSSNRNLGFPSNTPCTVDIDKVRSPPTLNPSLNHRKEETFQQSYSDNTGSLKRRKELRTASLSSQLKESITEPKSSECINQEKPVRTIVIAKPTEDKVSFARTFQLCQQKPVISRLAVNRSVSEYNLSRPDLDKNMERSFLHDSSPEMKGNGQLRSSHSEIKLDRNPPDNLYRVPAFSHENQKIDVKVNRMDTSQSLSSYTLNRYVAEQRMQKIREMKNRFLGIDSTPPENVLIADNSSSSRLTRSHSVEPDIRSQQIYCRSQSAALHRCVSAEPTDSNARVSCEQRVEDGEDAAGVYHAEPVQVDSNGSEDSSQDEEEDEDEEEDAQTVIFKSSPFSSPGLVLSRSASLTMTPLPYSPRCTPLPPAAGGDSPSPPPRPPPPTNYTPPRDLPPTSHASPCDQFSSLPRNWREQQLC